MDEFSVWAAWVTRREQIEDELLVITLKVKIDKHAPLHVKTDLSNAAKAAVKQVIEDMGLS